MNLASVTKVQLHEKRECSRAATLSWQASPYLYPCSVQYYLIVASIICQMYRHIGVMTSPAVSANERLSDVVTSRGDDVGTSTSVDCDKVCRCLSVVQCCNQHFFWGGGSLVPSFPYLFPSLPSPFFPLSFPSLEVAHFSAFESHVELA